MSFSSLRNSDLGFEDANGTCNYCSFHIRENSQKILIRNYVCSGDPPLHGHKKLEFLMNFEYSTSLTNLYQSTTNTGHAETLRTQWNTGQYLHALDFTGY